MLWLLHKKMTTTEEIENLEKAEVCSRVVFIFIANYNPFSRKSQNYALSQLRDIRNKLRPLELLEHEGMTRASLEILKENQVCSRVLFIFIANYNSRKSQIDALKERCRQVREQMSGLEKIRMELALELCAHEERTKIIRQRLQLLDEKRASEQEKRAKLKRYNATEVRDLKREREIELVEKQAGCHLRIQDIRELVEQFNEHDRLLELVDTDLEHSEYLSTLKRYSKVRLI